MPNIELHGYGDLTDVIKQKVRHALRDHPDARNGEIVTTAYSTVVEDFSGRPMPFLRVIASLGGLAEVKRMLAPLNEPMEVMLLGEWVPPQGGGPLDGSLPIPSSSDNPEPLRISPQCMAKYAGGWVRPAQLSQTDINEILDRLPMTAARELHKLLVEHCNEVTMKIVHNHTRVYHKALQQPVGSKYYRLASGTDRQGRYRSQLWEVLPST